MGIDTNTNEFTELVTFEDENIQENFIQDFLEKSFCSSRHIVDSQCGDCNVDFDPMEL